MSAVRKQLERWESYEPWKQEHVEAMLCRDVEDALKLGVSIFRELVSMRKEILRRGKDGSPPSRARMEELEMAFERWYVPVPLAQACIDGLTRAGHAVAHEREFSEAVVWFRANIFDPEAVMTGAARARLGKGRTLAEMKDALRHTH